MAFSISHNLNFEPRVTHCLGFSGVKLGDAIELYLDQHRPMELTIVGPSATLATHWARQHFEGNPRLKWYEDEPFGNPTTLGIDADQLFDPVQYQLTLAPLDRDDIIRIMLEFQPQACAGVIGRLQSDQFTEIGSDLRIWLRLLEELVDHPNESALNLLWTIFQAELAENKCTSTEAIRKLLDTFASSRTGRSTLALSLLEIDEIQTRLVAQCVVEQLQQQIGLPLQSTLSSKVILRVAGLVAEDQSVNSFLNRLCSGSTVSMSASILHQTRSGWKPSKFHKVSLLSAQFDGAEWSSVDVRKSMMLGCNLADSKLERAHFDETSLDHCDFSNCCLAETKVDETSMFNCSLENARLEGSTWCGGSSRRCNFESSTATGSTWHKHSFNVVNFQHASLGRCAFEKCEFNQVDFDEANLRSATFRRSSLLDCRLKRAELDGARFDKCGIGGIDFEDAQFDEVNFTECFLSGSIWSGSRLKNCCFDGSRFFNAKLAEIVWQGCDFGSASLKGAIFHFGSTRCGLVGSPYPSHGSRTGFYTDMLEEQYFKEPALIRRAALLDCDLRHAYLEGVDFYLVDLTGSQLTVLQREQALATGALGLD